MSVVISRITVVFIAIILIIFCCSYQSFNNADSNCMDLFKQAFQNMKSIDPQSGKGLSIKYVVTMQAADGKLYTDNIELLTLNKKAKVVSTEATIYQDDKTMVVVRPQSNTIFITKPINDTFRKSQLQGIIALQDSVFSKMTLKDCSVDQFSNKKIDFTAPVIIQNKMGISSVSYWINPEKISIKKVQMNYVQGERQTIKSIVFEFVALNNNYSGLPFEGSALSKVLDGKNNLKPLYKNYSVMDNRFTKKR